MRIIENESMSAYTILRGQFMLNVNGTAAVRIAFLMFPLCRFMIDLMKVKMGIKIFS